MVTNVHRSGATSTGPEAQSETRTDPPIGYTWAMDVTEVLADLRAEQQALDDIVAGLDAEQWQLPTPSPGWTVADQIGHLTYFDRNAALAITDPDGVPGRHARAPRLGRWRWRLGGRHDARAVPGDVPRRTPRRLAVRSPGTGRGRGDTRQRHADRMVRTVDGIEVVPHRAVDGVLGPRPGRRRHRRRHPRADRSVASHRAARIHHPRLDLRQPGTRRTVDAGARRADLTVGRDLGVRSRRRCGVDRGDRRGLLPRHHPASPRRRHRPRRHRRIGPRLDGEGPALRRPRIRWPSCRRSVGA